MGRVRFIPKSDKDPSTFAAHHPITLLSTLGKIFKRVIKIKFESFLENYALLHKGQYDFRKQRSCEHAIHALLKKAQRCARSTSVSRPLCPQASKALSPLPDSPTRRPSHISSLRSYIHFSNIVSYSSTQGAAHRGRY